MTRFLSFVFPLFFPSIAAADCVSYNFAPNPGSGFAGFGRFENSCSYQVVIRFRYSDGQTGLAGPLQPGQTERGYHGEAREIEYTWCDFDASACSPAPIGRANPFSEDESVLSQGYELHIQEQELALARQTCLSNYGKSNRTDGCGPESDALVAAMEAFTRFQSDNAIVMMLQFPDYLLSREVSDENPLGETNASSNQGYSSNDGTDSGNITGCFVQTFDYPEGQPEDSGQTYHVNNCGAPVYCQSKPAWETNGEETWAFRSYVGQGAYFGGAWSHSIILSTCTLDDSRYLRSHQR